MIPGRYIKTIALCTLFVFAVLLLSSQSGHVQNFSVGSSHCLHDVDNSSAIVNFATWKDVKNIHKLNHSSWPGFNANLFPVACPGSTRSMKAWERVSELFLTKANLNIMVVGGSEAAGVDCSDGASKGKACAWSSRLVNMLSCVVPKSKVNLQNLATGGTTITVALASLAAWVRSQPDLDVLLVDFIVNDAFEAQDMRSGNISQNLIAAYEKFVILAYEYQPHIELMFVNTCCLDRCIPVSNAIRIVADYYGIPIVSYTDMADVVSKIDGNNLTEHYWLTHATHPPWVIHQFIADTIMRCLHQHVNRHEFLRDQHSTLSAKTAMARLDVCDSPLSEYSSNSPSLAGVAATNWTFYEDRRGKPGFISNGPNATISFAVKFGPNPRMILTFLRGYKDLADAYIWFDNDRYKRAKLPGLYQPSDHEYGLNVTQSYLLVINVAQKMFQPEYGLMGVLGFSIKPNAKTRVNFEVSPNNNSTKFKIINLQSC
jgi:hypothetical protein